MHCRLIVPGLFWPDISEVDVQASASAPSLQLLLARGRKSVEASGSLEAWLLRRFGCELDPPPVAPYTLLGDGGDPGEGIWLRADPVHLAVDRDQLALVDSSAFEITRDEADAIVATLDTHFAQDGLEFHAPDPKRWYVRLATPAEFTASPIGAVRGQSIDAFLPAGEAGSKWRSRMNEAQMVLHEHAVNLAREARRALPINSVWFWGQGRVSTLRAPAIRRMIAVDPLALGLARASDIATLDLPATAARLVAETDTPGVAWIVLGVAGAAADSRDAAGWVKAVETLERDWFAPLLAALRAGRIGMLTIEAFGAGQVLSAEATGSDLRAFWRRPKPLAAYVRA